MVDKPAGLAVLPDGWDPSSPYLLKQLSNQYGQLWVVHRLDKVTSGVMLFCRSASSHRNLNYQFEQHAVVKNYVALVQGNPSWNKIDANWPLRSNVGHKHITIVDPKRGKPATTHFILLQNMEDCSMVEALPGTGRTHQIRAHASALGHPLLADFLYGAGETSLINRPALHATKIQFIHPTKDSSICFTSPLPDDFRSTIIKCLGDIQ